LTIGIVQEIARTDKGAPYIVVNGTRLYASKCKTPPTGLAVGMKIDFDATPFGDTGRDGKRPMGLNSWKAVMDAAGQPETGSTVSDVDILRSVSNVVGNACAAGTVKSPEELEKWFVAAFAGFTRTLPIAAALLTAQTNEPDFDDSDRLNEAPPASFYENLPPPKTGSRW
jgi:hypothetical protein